MYSKCLPSFATKQIHLSVVIFRGQFWVYSRISDPRTLERFLAATWNRGMNPVKYGQLWGSALMWRFLILNTVGLELSKNVGFKLRGTFSVCPVHTWENDNYFVPSLELLWIDWIILIFNQLYLNHNGYITNKSNAEYAWSSDKIKYKYNIRNTQNRFPNRIRLIYSSHC